MRSLLIRILIAVVFVLIIFAILPPLFRIFGVDALGDVLMVFKAVIAGLAALYVLAGPAPPTWS